MQQLNGAVQRAQGRYDKSDPKKSTSGKICPFMSSKDNKVECTEECQIHKGKKGYECPFSELNKISYNLNPQNFRR